MDIISSKFQNSLMPKVKCGIIFLIFNLHYMGFWVMWGWGCCSQSYEQRHFSTKLRREYVGLGLKEKSEWPILYHTQNHPSPVSGQGFVWTRTGWVYLLSLMMSSLSVEAMYTHKIHSVLPHGSSGQVFILAVVTTEAKVEIIVSYVYIIHNLVEYASFLMHRNVYYLVFDPLKTTGSVYYVINTSWDVSCFTNCC